MAVLLWDGVRVGYVSDCATERGEGGGSCAALARQHCPRACDSD